MEKRKPKRKRRSTPDDDGRKDVKKRLKTVIEQQTGLVDDLIPLISEYAEKSNKFITKTEAKRHYLLDDGELNTIKCIEKRNPHGSFRSGPMHLYDIEDLTDLAVAKWGSLSELEDEHANRVERSQKRQQAIHTKSSARHDLLVSELHKHGLQLRSDSRLCDAFIAGKETSVEYVVNTMAEMTFLYKHTDYGAALWEYISGEKEYKGYYNFDECSEHVRHDCVKRYIEENNGLMSREQLQLILPQHLHTLL